MQTQAQEQDDIIYPRVFRRIYGDTTGGFFVNDSIVVLNNGSLPMYNDIVYIPKPYDQNLDIIQASGPGGIDLDITKTYDDFYFVGYTVEFESPVLAGEEYIYLITSAYHSLISIPSRNTWTVGSDQELISTFVSAPSLSHTIENFSMWFGVSSTQAEFYNLPNGSVVSFTTDRRGWSWFFGPVDPMNTEEFVTQWRDNLESPRDFDVTRTITMDLWGYFHVTDEYTVTLRGKVPSVEVTVILPSYAQNLTVRDSISVLPYLPERASPSGETRLLVQTRYALLENYTYTFSVGYKIPSAEHQTATGFLYDFEMDLSPKVDGVIRHQTVELLFAGDTLFYEFSEEPTRVVYQGFTIGLYYDSVNTTHQSSLEVSAVYLPSYLTAVGRPLFISLVIGLLASLYIFTRRKDQVSVVKPVGPTVVAVDIFVRFSEAYDEKVALTMQLEKLDNDRSRKKVSSREYNERKRRYEVNLKNMNEEIKQMFETIQKRGGRMSEIAKNLEMLEAERDNARAVISNLYKRYMVRRIGRRVYEELKTKEQKKMEKLTRKIDGLIFELKQAA
jgi:hypothetical protein